MEELIAKLRTRLVMSMFATHDHLYAENEKQRQKAADALEAQQARIAELREAITAMAEEFRRMAEGGREMTFDEWAEQYFGRNVDVPEACRAAWKAALLEAADYVDTNMGGTTASLYLRCMAEGET